MRNYLFRPNRSLAKSRKAASSPLLPGRKAQNLRSLRVEPLEDRRLLAVITVDSLADGPVNLADGNTTLRDALALAADAAWPGADEIRFADSLGLDTTPGTIELTEGQLEIDSDLTIAGPGAEQLAVDGAGRSRVFYVGGDVSVTLSRITITGGEIPYGSGAGILAERTDLSVSECVVSNNRNASSGGGIGLLDSSLMLTSSAVTGNSAVRGGGIETSRIEFPATIIDSTISDNSAVDGGGVYSGTDGSLAIIRSSVSDNEAERRGGAIYSGEGAFLVATHSRFDNNALSDSDGEGGALYSSSGAVAAIVGSTFTDNFAATSGGAIASHAELTIVASTFQDNSVTGSWRDDEGGGAIFSSSVLTIRGSDLTGNYTVANGKGGCIYTEHGTLTLTDSLLADNAAHSGGAIWSDNSRVLIGNSTVGDNHATAGGGGIYAYRSQVTFEASVLEANRAGSGGGVYARGGALSIVGSTISKNDSVTIGGAIRGDATAVAITNSAVFGNHAGSDGSVIDSRNNSPTIPVLTISSSTIVGNSSATDGATISSLGTPITLVNSIIFANDSVGGPVIEGKLSEDSGFNLIGVDPQFVQNPDPGADGQWGTADDVEGDLRLTALSPAVDMGSNRLLGEVDSDGDGPDREIDLDGSGQIGDFLLTHDLAGKGRIYQRISGGRVDIGAYEYRATTPAGREALSGLVTTLEDTVDLYDGVVSLREALFYQNVEPGPDTIEFDPSLTGDRITLTGSSLVLTAGIRLDASALPSLTIDADGRSTAITVLADGASLVGLTITGGSARSGGGVYAVGTASIVQCDIRGNSASDAGGGIYHRDGTLTVMDSTVLGNTAGLDSGGIHSTSGVLNVVNSTIVGNTSGEDGGGIGIDYSDMNVVQCTITANDAVGRGGGIFDYRPSYLHEENVTITNSILFANNDLDGSEFFGDLNDASGFNLIGLDPLFNRMPDPGADGIWGTEDDIPGDLHLTDRSPALEMGSNLYLDEIDSDGPGPDREIDLDGSGVIGDYTIATDGNDQPRVYGDRVDIGAYELQSAPLPGRETPSSVVTTLDDTFDLYDGLVSLRDALFYQRLDEVAGTIRFDPSLDGGRIVLGGSSLVADESVQIVASDLESLTIDGDGKSGVFEFLQNDVELTGLTVTGGKAIEGGGILTFGTLTLTDCALVENAASEKGGGIRALGDSLIIFDSIVADNSCGDLDGGAGGGIYAGGSLVLRNSTISGNSATATGGGIYGNTVVAWDSSLVGNFSSTNGGGIYCGRVFVGDNLVVLGNSASGNGGGIYISHMFSQMIGNNVTISGNSAGENGGGAYFGATNFTRLNNLIVSGNTAAGDGGGIYQYHNSLAIRNGTIAGNSAAGEGGGIASLVASLTVFSLFNTIVAQNAAASFDEVAGGIDEGAHNLIGDGSGMTGLVDGVDGNQIGTGDAPIDPRFADIQTYTDIVGPDGLFGTDDDGSLGDFRLLPGSPAIDGGDNFHLDEIDSDGDGPDRDVDLDSSGTKGDYTIETDLAGNPRVAGLAVDMGAYEPDYLVVTTLDDELDADLTDPGDLSLREALALAADEDLRPGADVIMFSTSLGLDTTPGRVALQLGELVIDSDVTIAGPSAEQLAVDADADGDGTGESRVFYIGPGVSATIEGVMITGGYATDGGAGIYDNGEALTLRNTIIVDNYSVSAGGGLHSRSGKLLVDNCTIIRNGTKGWGGGAYKEHGDFEITDSTFLDNYSYLEGGGIYQRRGKLTIANSTFAHNSTDYAGGAIYQYFGTLTVRNSTVSRNSAGVAGGGILGPRGMSTIIDTFVLQNITTYDGVGVYAYELTLVNSVVSGNVTGGEGGGVMARSTLEMVNSTVAGNHAAGYGVGVYAPEYRSRIANSIIALNSTPNGTELRGPLSEGSWLNLIGIDPQFVQNPGPGADGTWGTEDDVAGDFRLTELSPAVEMGSNLYLDEIDSDGDGPDFEIDLDGSGVIGDHAIGTDFLGQPRRYGDNVDMGAVEFQADPVSGRETPSAVVNTLDDVFDLYDGLTSLREALFYHSIGATPSPVLTDPALDGGRIVLSGGSLIVDRAMHLDASALTSLVLDGDGKCGVVEVVANDVQLTGLTITGGAAQNGGGILSYGTLTVTDCEITGNTAAGNGGGICAFSGTLTVTDSIITDNAAIDGDGQGGGIYHYYRFVNPDLNELLLISDSIVSGNSATGEGGGIYGRSITASNLSVERNSAEGDGGGIWSDGLFIADGLSVAGNSASGNGGGLCSYQAALSSANVVVSGNTAAGSGGGVQLFGCEYATLSNVRISGNSAAADGGGLHSRFSDLAVLSSTIASNSSGGEGGGVSFGYGDMAMHNVIVARNTAATSPDLHGPVNAGDHNVVGDGTGSRGLNDGVDGNQVGTAEEPIDPRFVDVQTYADIVGLDGVFGTDDDGPLGNYRLLSGSPAIDAGNNLYLDEIDSDGDGPDRKFDLDGDGEIGNYTIETDLAGNPRVAGEAVDIGAYEYQPLIVTTLDDELDADLTDRSDLSLREALALAADEERFPGLSEITFAPSLGLDATPGRIELQLGQLVIDSDVRITGPGASNLAIDALGASRVFYVGPDLALALHGLTITGGNVDASVSRTDGAGVFAEQSEVRITSCAVVGNTADGNGGGVCIAHGSLDVIDSVVENNSATDGGGIAAIDSSLSISASRVSGNHAPGGRGGGLFVNAAADAAVLIADVTLTGNSATGGGAVYSSVTLAVADSTVSGNIGTSLAGGIQMTGGSLALLSSFLAENAGGALGMSNCSGLIADTILANNQTNGSGGAIRAANSEIAVVNSRLIENRADRMGGAIYATGGEFVLTNSALARNDSGSIGGGFYSTGSTTRIVNSVITGNSADYRGGGLDLAGTEHLYNTIVAENTIVGTGSHGPDFVGDIEAGAHNLIGDGSGMTGLVGGVDGNQVGTSDSPIDPVLLDLLSYAEIVGPDGVYGTADDASLRDYRLLPDSPAIDAGSGLYLDEVDSDGDGPDVEIDLDGSGAIGDYEIATDLSGRPRVTGAGVDLGAHESSWYVLQATEERDVIAITPGTVGGDWHEISINGTVTTYDPALGDLWIDGLGGGDRLWFNGTGADESFVLRPGAATLNQSQFMIHVDGAQSVNVDAGEGNDRVLMIGSSGSNRLKGYGTHAVMTDSQRSYRFHVEGCETLSADATGGDRSYAYLYDSPGDDVLTATPTSATMDRAGAWPDTTATGFDRVYAFSTAGGSDSAELTGSEGGNQYRGYPTHSTLTDRTRSFYHHVRGFRSVKATGSESGAADRAHLYDAFGDDTLYGREDYLSLEDTAQLEYRNEILYFDLVYARSRDSDAETDDLLDIDDLACRLVQSGSW